MSLGPLGWLADNGRADSLAGRHRQRRMRVFLDLCRRLRPRRRLRLLDAGGTGRFWALHRPQLDAAGLDLDITVVNVDPGHDAHAGIAVLRGDVRDLRRFDDRSFDLVFSNSVIEHVGTWDDQRSAAGELRRVARHWWVQTPNRSFPIEPHAVFPCWQFLPHTARAALLCRRRWGWLERTDSKRAALAQAGGIRLLTEGGLARLFPDARIIAERSLGLVKSLIAVDRAFAGGLR